MPVYLGRLAPEFIDSRSVPEFSLWSFFSDSSDSLAWLGFEVGVHWSLVDLEGSQRWQAGSVAVVDGAWGSEVVGEIPTMVAEDGRGQSRGSGVVGSGRRSCRQRLSMCLV
jgi:hypothetical protein